ncbi:hypothetical protein KKF34_09880 [Myxococcota bacterium]|nr:hypothetical protein [Myxococcota bacterium]MBU1379672.1 hypothetical protein [Myxococcota bacterium]MBU1497174.1 hypothetical protein [Myxococcota bacterium]
MALLIFFFLNIHAQTADTFYTLIEGNKINLPMPDGFKFGDEELEEEAKKDPLRPGWEFVRVITDGENNCVILKKTSLRMDEHHFSKEIKVTLKNLKSNSLLQEQERDNGSQNKTDEQKPASIFMHFIKNNNLHGIFTFHFKPLGRNTDSDEDHYRILNLINLSGYFLFVTCYTPKNYKDIEVLMGKWGTAALGMNPPPPKRRIIFPGNFRKIVLIIAFAFFGYMFYRFVRYRKKEKKSKH